MGQYSPAAALEAVVGGCTLALHPLTASCGTSPQGDAGLLFEQHVRSGRPPLRPLSHDFLAQTAQRCDMLTASIDAEVNQLMRAHLRVVQAVVSHLPEQERGAAAPDGKLTLAAAWAWLVGHRTVQRVLRAVMPSISVILQGMLPTMTTGTKGASPASAATSAVTLFDDVASAESNNVSEYVPPMSTRADAFLTRSHLDRDAISRLMKLRLAGSHVAATMQLLRLPPRITPGAPNVTEDDVTNEKDLFARLQRGDTTIDEHLINLLCGTLAQFCWAVVDVTLDPHVSCVTNF